MREIIFRGKRVDNGEWVFGYYVNHLTRTLCPIGDFFKEGDIKHYIAKSGFADWNMSRALELIEVISSTVGQYTGVKDKNGKEVYEGDRVRMYGRVRLTFQVNFNQKECGFYVGSDPLLASDSENMEIIGNIQDQKDDV